jgi:hypothetical protein
MSFSARVDFRSSSAKGFALVGWMTADFGIVFRVPIPLGVVARLVDAVRVCWAAGDRAVGSDYGVETGC